MPAVKDPVKAGYEFKGWTPSIPAKFPSANLTCVAKWSQTPEPQPEPTPTVTTSEFPWWIVVLTIVVIVAIIFVARIV